MPYVLGRFVVVRAPTWKIEVGSSLIEGLLVWRTYSCSSEVFYFEHVRTKLLVFAGRIEWRLLASRPGAVSSKRKTDQSHRRMPYTADVFHFEKIFISSPDARSLLNSKWEIRARFKDTIPRARYKMWCSAGYYSLWKDTPSCFGEHYWRYSRVGDCLLRLQVLAVCRSCVLLYVYCCVCYTYYYIQHECFGIHAIRILPMSAQYVAVVLCCRAI